MKRFSRQILLPQVGTEGQLRIGQTPLCAPPGLDPATRRFAELYAAATGHPAGPGLTIDSPEQANCAQSWRHVFRHPSSRALGLGAGVALCSTLSALGLPIPEPDSRS